MRPKSSPQEGICKWPESEQARACLSTDLTTHHPTRPVVPICPPASLLSIVQSIIMLMVEMSELSKPKEDLQGQN